MNNIKIPFKGWDLIAWVNKQDGSARIAVKPICEAIGVSYGSQYNKLNADRELFNCLDIEMVAEDGKTRPMLTVPAETLNGWLFGISRKKVKPEVAGLLLEFQRFCFNAINEAVSGNANAEVVVLLRQHIELLTSELRALRLENQELRERYNHLENTVVAYGSRMEALEESHETLQGSVVSGAARTLRQGHMRLVKSA